MKVSQTDCESGQIIVNTDNRQIAQGCDLLTGQTLSNYLNTVPYQGEMTRDGVFAEYRLEKDFLRQ